MIKGQSRHDGLEDEVIAIGRVRVAYRGELKVVNLQSTACSHVAKDGGVGRAPLDVVDGVARVIEEEEGAVATLLPHAERPVAAVRGWERREKSVRDSL